MSNNKQQPKPENPNNQFSNTEPLTHAQRVAIANTMSNNKQISLDYYITKLTEILGPYIQQISRDDNERIARLEKQAKRMNRQEIIDAYHINPSEAKWQNRGFEYYNETYGGNND